MNAHSRKNSNVVKSIVVIALAVGLLATTVAFAWPSDAVISGVHIQTAYIDGSMALPNSTAELLVLPFDVGNAGYVVDQSTLSDSVFSQWSHASSSVGYLSAGDVFYTRFIFHNTSNTPVYGRFRFASDAGDATIAYAVRMSPLTDSSDPSSAWSCPYDQNASNSPYGWFYCLNPLMPNTDYTIWVAGYVIQKNGNDVKLGAPSFDLIQVDGAGIHDKYGWNIPEGDLGFIPVTP